MSDLSNREFYETIWADPVYGSDEIGATRYEWAYKQLYKAGEPWLVFDIGCGRGGFIRWFHAAPNWSPALVGIDLDNFGVYRDYYGFDCDLTNPVDLAILSGRHAGALVCLDVLEHLPPEALPEAVGCFSAVAPFAVITVAHQADEHHARLHLTVRDVAWWRALFAPFWDIEVEESLHEGMATGFLLRRKEETF